jgi:hypothetical protein
MKRPSSYLIIILALMLILPLISIGIDAAFFAEAGSLIALMGKWFVFWGLGIRLALAGVMQIRTPGYTVQKIFGLDSPESHHFVRELGFATLSMGLLGILSLWMPELRLGGALAGGLYMGLAGIYHAIKKPATSNEWVAMLTDLMIAALMVVYLLSQLG